MKALVRAVYCSGSIAKGTSDSKRICWTDVERNLVQTGAGSARIVFLNPDDPITDAANTLGQFGRDMYQVMIADAVIVDARERRGIGIGVEMAAAATLGTPIIVVAPRNSLYRQDQLNYRGVLVNDYVHPHVSSLASCVVNDFEEAGRAVEQLPETKDRSEPRSLWLRRAIDEYIEHVLPGDPPMVAAVELLAQLGTDVGGRAAV